MNSYRRVYLGFGVLFPVTVVAQGTIDARVLTSWFALQSIEKVHIEEGVEVEVKGTQAKFRDLYLIVNKSHGEIPDREKRDGLAAVITFRLILHVDTVRAKEIYYNRSTSGHAWLVPTNVDLRKAFFWWVTIPEEGVASWEKQFWSKDRDVSDIVALAANAFGDESKALEIPTFSAEDVAKASKGDTVSTFRNLESLKVQLAERLKPAAVEEPQKNEK